MADLMRHHIGLRELARARACIATVEAAFEIAEERGVEINLLVARAVERPHRGLRHPALVRAGRAGEHHQRRRAIALAVLLECVFPDDLGRSENARNKLAHLVARRASLAGGLRLLLARATADHLGAADQNARVDTERIADNAQNDDGADAKATTTDRKAEAATASAGIATAIFNVVALRQIIKAHSFLLSPRSNIHRRVARVHEPAVQQRVAGCDFPSLPDVFWFIY